MVLGSNRTVFAPTASPSATSLCPLPALPNVLIGTCDKWVLPNLPHSFLENQVDAKETVCPNWVSPPLELVHALNILCVPGLESGTMELKSSPTPTPATLTSSRHTPSESQQSSKPVGKFSLPGEPEGKLGAERRGGFWGQTQDRLKGLYPVSQLAENVGTH